jgi:superoxide dismutase, Cu-Zn family
MRISAAGLLVAGLAMTACAAEDAAGSNPTTDNDRRTTTESGTLAPPGTATGAFTYDSATAPAGARLTVTVTEPDATRTEVALDATGLVGDRGYAVHAHTNPCGPTGDAAGPHHQNKLDPAATKDKSSVDPAYANAHNEIWLDLRTDAKGAGTSRTVVPFQFGDRAPASVVLHENSWTATDPGHAGTAGARVACLTVDLG